ncbi:MAG: type II toxin-antitoxin system prevent-host-death family antitoxin [Propionibacteriaceae bacterium]
MSANVDLKELRQNASELVRRAHAGEEFTITVSGQPGARLVPAQPIHWRRWDEIADLFSDPTESDWQHDRELVGNDPRDPWAKQ